MYRYVFLDLDKTIFDFDTAENEAIREVFKSEDLTITDDLFAEYKQINQATWRKLETGELTKKEVITKRFELFFERHHIKVDGVQKDRLFRSVLESNTQLIDGAHSLLEYLQNKDYNVCSASNGVYETQMKRLKGTQLFDYFDHHFISEEIGYDKPHVEFFEKAIERLGNIDKKQILMVGDSLTSDIEGANRANIDACYFGEEIDHKAKYHIKSLEALKEIL